ncbi:MAG: hypothetical protein ACQGVK_02705 [Myxococcota bacterium]
MSPGNVIEHTMTDTHSHRFAYVSGDALYVCEGEGVVRRVESRFGQAVRDRAQRIAQRHAWKREGQRDGLLSGRSLWGSAAGEADALRVAIVGVGRGRRPGELLYALDTDEVSGVFAVPTREPDDGEGQGEGEGPEEDRLFHSNHVRVDQLAAHPSADAIACSVRADQGATQIGVMKADGTGLDQVTEGDSLDQAPCWVPGRERTLVFQSAGIGRDSNGEPVALAPFAVEQLDLETGELLTRAESPRFDYLTPRIGPDGLLYTLRRPWQGDAAPSHWNALLDFLAMPFRLLHALFQWLNLFTAMYTGRKLTSSGGPEQDGPDVKWMVVWGNLIEAHKAERRGRLRGEDAPDLVPRSYELVRHRPDGEPEVLAKAVLAFDVASDGSLLVSNGSAVDCIAPDGARKRLVTAARIGQVVALD